MVSANQGFHGGQQTTLLAATGADLVEWLQHLRNYREISAEALNGVEPKTRQDHLARLRLLRNMGPAHRQLRLVDSILATLGEQRTLKGWKPTTWMRALGSTAGALARLEQYAGRTDLNLQQSSLWRDAMKGAEKYKTAHIPTKAVPCTKIEAYATVNRLIAEGRTTLASQVAILWLSAARPGDLLQVRREDLQVRPDGNLWFVIRAGKVQKHRKKAQPLHTVIPPEWMETIQQGISGGHRHVWSFPSLQQRELAVKAITKEMRLTNPRLEARSLRSGSLRCMMEAGVPEETLLLFSGHSTIAMLREYVGWDDTAVARGNRMRTAAKHLLGGTALAPRPLPGGS